MEPTLRQCTAGNIGVQAHPQLTLRMLHEQAVREGRMWYVHDGMIELVDVPDEDKPYDADMERKLLELGVEWIWM